MGVFDEEPERGPHDECKNEIDRLAGHVLKLRTALIALVGADSKEELEKMEMFMRLAPAPAEDKAKAIDAIHALLATMEPT